MRKRPWIALLALASALVIALVLALLLVDRGSGPAAGQGESAGGFDGAALPEGLPAHDFTLTSVLSGRPVSLARYKGQVTVLAFPYATCSATCTLLAQQIRGALDELPRPVPVLLVSADPASDTPARVRGFLARVSLTGRAQYLTGSQAALRPVWRAFGVVPASAGASAYAAHAVVVLLDERGRERVIFGLEQLSPEGLAHDICKLAHGCG
jgi:protein SCO1